LKKDWQEFYHQNATSAVTFYYINQHFIGGGGLNSTNYLVAKLLDQLCYLGETMQELKATLLKIGY